MPRHYGALSECDSGEESANRAGSVWRRNGKTYRPTKFSTKTFVGESKEGIDSALMKPAAAACRVLSMMRSSFLGKIRGSR